MYCRFTKPNTKIAAFDLDHTLLKPKNDRKFARNKNDACYMFENVYDLLKDYELRGYKIVIFTNQKRIAYKKNNQNALMTKEERASYNLRNDIVEKVDLWFWPEVDVFISYKDDQYRKPAPGMYTEFLKRNGEVKDLFYVGDAAGRETDFSNSDRLFAYNIGADFKTPEQFFLGDPFPPLPEIKSLVPLEKKKVPLLEIPELCVIILIGMPGSGKSRLAQKIHKKFAESVIVSNDTSGSSTKTNTAFRQAIMKGLGAVIVDNTNSTKGVRRPFIHYAQKNDYPVYAIHCSMPEEYCKHLNIHRCVKKGDKCVPPVVYSIYKNKFQKPEESEGFDGIYEHVPKLKKKVFEMVYF